MLIGLLVILTLVAVFGAGEAVRSQCRRMLARPVPVRQDGAQAAVFASRNAA